MRKAGLAIFLIAILATPLLLLQSQVATLWLLKTGVSLITGQRLELVDPDIDLARGLVSARELHLFNSDGPPLLSILQLDANISLQDLYRSDLAQSVFRVKSVQVYLSDDESATNPSPLHWMGYANWLPRKLNVEQFHLISNERELWIFPLKNISGQRLDAADFQISADADYGGEPLRLVVDLLGVIDQSEFRKLNLSSKILAPQSGSEIELHGEATASRDELHYDLQLNANYRDVSAVLGAIEGAMKLQGKLQVSGDLKGNIDGFELSNAGFVLDNMPAYGFEAGGNLTLHRTEKSELRLVAAGEMGSLEPLIEWLDLDLTPLGKAQAHITIAGELDHLMVEEFILRTNSVDGLGVSLSGHFKLGDIPSTGNSEGDQVQIDLQGESLAVLKRWIGAVPYDPGPWRASGLLRRGKERAELNNIIIEFGKADTLQVRADGRVGQAYGVVTDGLGAVQDIDLLIRYKVPDSAELSVITGTELPPYHEVSGDIRLTGSPDKLRFSEGTSNVSASDLDAKLSNISAVLTPENDIQIKSIYADLKVNLSDTSALSQYTSGEIPALGEFNLNGSLKQSGKVFRLDKLEASIDGDAVKVRSSGAIENLATLEGIVLKTEFSGISTSDLLINYFDGFVIPEQLGELAGAFVLLRPKVEWHLRDLSLSNQNNPTLRLDVAGNIQDLTGLPETALSIDFQFLEEALLEHFTTLKLKPTTGKIDLKAEPNRIKLDGHVQFGDSLITGSSELGHENNEIRGLKVSLESASIQLSDIGLQTDKSDYKPSEKLEEVNAPDELEQRLHDSPRYPTEFKLKIGHLSGESSNVQDINIHITGEQKRYTLRQFSARYDNAPAEIRGIIDLNASPPFVSLAGEAISVPMYRIAADLGSDFQIKGNVSVSGGLSAQGLTTGELVRTTNGSLAFAMQDMVVQGAAYDVLATDFLAWIYSGAVLESSTEITCTMANFAVKNGVAVSDSIYIESRRMIATGKGTLDVAQQKIDITLTPRSKAQLLSIPSSVTLKGDLSNPKSIISPVAATAKASTDLLLFVPRLAMKMFGLKSNRDRNVTPCVAKI